MKSLQTRASVWLAMAMTLWVAFSLAGCGGGNRADRDASDNQAVSQSDQGTAPSGQAANNTGRNADDTSDSLTATDQNESDADRAISESIRKTIVDSDVSANGKNVKIITRNGVVTLRGPVNSQAEKDFIANTAKSAAGVTSVDDQTEIVTGSGS